MRGDKDVKAEQEDTFDGDLSRIRFHTQDGEGQAGVGEAGGGGVHQRAGANSRGQRSEVSRDNKEL